MQYVKGCKSGWLIYYDLSKLSRKNLKICKCPVLTSRKIIDEIKVIDTKPPLNNQHFLRCLHFFTWSFQYKLCYLKDEHKLQATNLRDQFTVLKTCHAKFDYLISEMLFIRNINPNLNTQSDSVRAKLFTKQLNTSTSFIP